MSNWIVLWNSDVKIPLFTTHLEPWLDTSLPRFRSEGEIIEDLYGRSVLPLFTSTGDAQMMWYGAGTLPKFTASGADWEFYGDGDADLPLFTAIGGSYDGGIGYVLATLYPFSHTIIGGGTLNEDFAFVPVIVLTGAGSQPDTGWLNYVFDNIIRSSSDGLAGSVGNLAEGTLYLTYENVFNRLFQIAITGHTSTSGNLSSIITLMLNAVVQSTSLGKAVVICLETLGLSEYTNYPFNSLIFYKGQAYGASSTGIYRLTGDDDAGTDIDATIVTRLDDFNTPALKNVHGASLGHSGGPMTFSLVADGGFVSTEQYTLQTQESGERVQNKRVKFGRGINRRYWGVRVDNRYGADFHIDSLELEVETKGRKVNE